MFRLSKVFLCMVMCSFIFACANQKAQQNLSKPDWQIKGKLGIKRSLLKSGSASFQWQQQGENYTIHVFNPLGQVQFSLYGNDHKAVYAHSDGTTLSDKSAEALLKRFNDWSLPIHQVSAWLHGKLIGSEYSINYDEQQRIKSFRQNHWQVSWRYKNDLTRPYRIRMQSEDTRITLIIKDYTLFQ